MLESARRSAALRGILLSEPPRNPGSLSPERVRVADVEADYLAAPGLVHGVRDHKALVCNLRAVADLLDLRVEPQIAVAVLERSRPPEGLDLCDRAGGTAKRPSLV